MAKLAKFLQGVAGAGGDPVYVEDTFSAYGYTDGPSTINNGIDLSTDGGLIITKCRSAATDWKFVDTERSGLNKALTSADTNSEDTDINGIASVTTTGYTLGSNSNYNSGSQDYVSYTFKKQKGFFDVITYSGTGSNQTISHDLGSTPGMIIVKAINNNDDAWYVWHRSIPQFGSNAQYRSVVFLDSTSAYMNYSIQTAQPDSSNIYVGSTWSTSGYNYVMYVFAHNDGDGIFGESGDQDIIKCGSYTGNGSDNGPTIDLGFEPQFFMMKKTSSSGYFLVYNHLAGLGAETSTKNYQAFSINDSEYSSDRFYATSTGIKISNANDTWNQSGATFIYMAINKFPNRPVEDPADVFKVSALDGSSDIKPTSKPNFPVDFAITHSGAIDAAGDKEIATKISNSMMHVNESIVESAINDAYHTWFSDTIHLNGLVASSAPACWMWKKHSGFCDVIAYPGNSVSGRTINHNLGVVPEMMWVKNRDSPVDWWCYHKDLGNTKYVKLNTQDAVFTDSSAWNNTTPTASVITLGNSGRVNYSNDNYIAYLFATVAGVSKVGSYTGTGSTQTIDCGFTNGVRFLMTKNVTSSGFANSQRDWLVYDTVRGINAGNDSYLAMNSSSQAYSADYIDQHSSGFTLTNTGGNDSNGSGGEYIFYAIAK